MRFYTKQHQHYCGIDLHARSMYVCILNGAGEIVVHKNVAAAPEAFMRVIAPYREDLVVAVECIFTWYWMADLCAEEKVPFVLGHALYMKAIHGGKAKNDRIDAHKIAVLLRGGMTPMAYVYPRALRATRDLLRPSPFRLIGHPLPLNNLLGDRRRQDRCSAPHASRQITESGCHTAAARWLESAATRELMSF